MVGPPFICYTWYLDVALKCDACFAWWRRGDGKGRPCDEACPKTGSEKLVGRPDCLALSLRPVATPPGGGLLLAGVTSGARESRRRPGLPEVADCPPVLLPRHATHLSAPPPCADFFVARFVSRPSGRSCRLRRHWPAFKISNPISDGLGKQQTHVVDMVPTTMWQLPVTKIIFIVVRYRAVLRSFRMSFTVRIRRE